MTAHAEVALATAYAAFLLVVARALEALAARASDLAWLERGVAALLVGLAGALAAIMIARHRGPDEVALLAFLAAAVVLRARALARGNAAVRLSSRTTSRPRGYRRKRPMTSSSASILTGFRIAAAAPSSRAMLWKSPWAVRIAVGIRAHAGSASCARRKS